MLGQTGQGSTSFTDASTRVFRVEVKGLRQTYESDKLSYPIRRSGSAFITVPYSRFNDELQRINRLGGTIVSIEPLNGLDNHHSAKQDATAAHADAKIAHTEEKSE